MRKLYFTAITTLLLLETQGGSVASGFIETRPGLLDDTSFFNLVTCGVLPGQKCQSRTLRWAPGIAGNLLVRLSTSTAEAGYARAVEDALVRAISDINSVSDRLKLGRVDEASQAEPSIHLQVTSLKAGEKISGTGSDLDGTPIEGAAVSISWNDGFEIQDATIVIAGDLLPEEIPSIVLEEVTQALGPINDIRNKAYEGVSIFSEDSNSQMTLGQQDRMVLQRLYNPLQESGEAGNQ